MKCSCFCFLFFFFAFCLHFCLTFRVHFRSAICVPLHVCRIIIPGTHTHTHTHTQKKKKKQQQTCTRHVFPMFLLAFWYENWVLNHQVINCSNLNLVNGSSYLDYSEYCPTACSKMAIHEGMSCLLHQAWIFFRMIKNDSSLHKLSGATAKSC